MKKILFLLLTAVTLSSCEKEGTGALYDSGLVKSVEFQSSSNKTAAKYIVKYDDLDRVYSINDTVFHYGPDDKVLYSRYTEYTNENGANSEKIIRKSYNWDNQRRLVSISVDSAYMKTIASDGVVYINNFVPYTEAYFYYTGFQTLPDSISANIGEQDTNIVFKKIYHSNGNISKIEDIYPVSTNTEERSNSIMLRSTFFDYNDQNNYLFPLYQKIGFLPKGLGYVASRKMVATSESVESVLLDNLSGQLDSKRTTIKNIYTSNNGGNGYPTLIQINSMINFGGDEYAKGGSSSTYIHY